MCFSGLGHCTSYGLKIVDLAQPHPPVRGATVVSYWGSVVEFFHPCIVCVLFIGPSLQYLKWSFFRNFFPLVLETYTRLPIAEIAMYTWSRISHIPTSLVWECGCVDKSEKRKHFALYHTHLLTCLHIHHTHILSYHFWFACYRPGRLQVAKVLSFT